MFVKLGGGKIKRKLLLSVLLLCGMALILNLNAVAATNGTTDNTIPKVSSIDPVNKAVVTNDKIIEVKFSEPVKYGTQWIELKTVYGQIKPIIKTINENKLTITPKAPLAKGLTYNLILHTGCVKDLSGNSLSLYKSSFTVSRLPLVKTIDPADKTVVTNDKIIEVQFSEPVKYGTQWIELKNSYGQIKPTIKTISGNTLTITPKTALAKGLTYNLILHTGCVKDLSGNSLSLYKSSFIVSRLSLAQMKDGIYRVQNFYYSNNRLPTYVSYGTSKIPITEFQKIIATQGLTINTTTANSVAKVEPDTSSVETLAKSLIAGSKSTYNSAVSIFNWVRDNISYSFYYNTKYGAEGTLKNMTGNCCDTSNLLVALARNAGIDARYFPWNMPVFKRNLVRTCMD